MPAPRPDEVATTVPSGRETGHDSHFFTEGLSGESTAGTPEIRGHTSQAIAVLDYAQTKTSVVAAVRSRMILAVFLERNLAVVLPKEVQESLVVASFHVEEPRDNLIVAPRFLESSPHDLANVRASDLSVHEKRIHGGPEGFVLLDHPLIEVVCDSSSTLALWPKHDGVVRSDLGRQVFDANR